MLSYKIILPRNVEVDIFNLPENFNELLAFSNVSYPPVFRHGGVSTIGI